MDFVIFGGLGIDFRQPKRISRRRALPLPTWITHLRIRKSPEQKGVGGFLINTTLTLRRTNPYSHHDYYDDSDDGQDVGRQRGNVDNVSFAPNVATAAPATKSKAPRNSYLRDTRLHHNHTATSKVAAAQQGASSSD